MLSYTTLSFIINLTAFFTLFSNIHISHGSVATCSRRAEILTHEFVANVLLSLAVKIISKID